MDMKKVIFSFIVLLSFVSCTVTKRVHNSGLHIQWKSNYKKIVVEDKIDSFYPVDGKEISQNDQQIVDWTNTDPIEQNTVSKIEEIDAIKDLDESPVVLNVVDNHQRVENELVVNELRYGTNRNIENQSPEEKKRKVEINWSTVGFFALLALLATVCLFAWFGTGLIAQIAVITLAILGFAMIIVVAYYIGYFFWFIFFGWMM